MLGTLNGALEVRQVSLEPKYVSAQVAGINEIIDKIPTLTEIHITYQLCIPANARETVDRALETHQSKCPTAQSLGNSVKISWEAEISEI
ncbi:uncharacterized protein METZ01_LOCUS307437 [marine metagenome]|jgi:uncharacterized OsmC-like protein|uniref:OsmC family protein n=1 Tax=marine metagenome TaxID=408172 RepID=A0A382MZZ3_9ZZZZ|tara:strand:+ start:305 stop:574 length:270 start_codon:yes stop_codon:yes gene_type:complete